MIHSSPQISTLHVFTTHKRTSYIQLINQIFCTLEHLWILFLFQPWLVSDNEKLLFFTDKQLGLTESDLENYSSLLVDKDGELTEMMPNFKESFVPRIEFLDDYSEKSYFDDKDIESLVGFIPDFEN